jgi:hypothetical protein
MADTRLGCQQREIMFRNRHKFNFQPVHFIFFLAVCVLTLFVVYALRLIGTAGRVSPNPTLVSRQASSHEKILLAAAQRELPDCPPGAIPMLPPSPRTGHHKVTLTWNQSTFYPDPQRHAVGYCLYRGTTQIVKKKISECLNCEQINKTSIEGTACIDDLAEDGVLYYYVAAAVNQGGTPSLFSNPTPAQIPLTTVPVGSPAAPTYPRCRALNGSQ